MSNPKTQEMEQIKSLLTKVYRSEKRVLKELGVPPKKKNRTGTLLYYMEFLYPSEQELLMKLVNNNSEFNVHEGTLPFLNRDFVINLLATIIAPNVHHTASWFSDLVLRQPDEKHSESVTNLKRQKQPPEKQQRLAKYAGAKTVRPKIRAKVRK